MVLCNGPELLIMSQESSERSKGEAAGWDLHVLTQV